MLTRIPIHRHQGQGREQEPVPAVPGRAEAPARGAGCLTEGGPLPRGEISLAAHEEKKSVPSLVHGIVLGGKRIATVLDG